jgi:hypothetical protein
VKICPACATEYPAERSHCERDGVLLVALTTGGGSSRAEDLVGQTVDGRYLVEAIVGKGGMGTVYACRHVVVGKPFAMKVLRSGVEQTEGVLQRFIREAQTANSIKSRHIVEMTDFGQLPSGQFYVTMDLLEGMDLGKALKQGMMQGDLLHVFTQVAEALELTHRRGVVHRDLKPDNVFLVRDGDDPLFVKLLDFGIAKALHQGPSGLTETGVVLGTPYYMSPEQARGEEVDHRTDIYSLGVIMYRAFTGKLPFVADSAVGVLTKHITEPPVLPSALAGVDGPIERVILRCMEKRRDDRFQSMGEVANALRAVRAAAYTGGFPGVHMLDDPTTVSGPHAALASQSGPYIAAAPARSGSFGAAGTSVHRPVAEVYTGAASANVPTVQVQASTSAYVSAYMGGAQPPEHTAAHGLAASAAIKVPTPRRRWPLLIGAVAALAAAFAIAISVSSLLGRPHAGQDAAVGAGAATATATASPSPSITEARPSEAPSASATAAATASAAASDTPEPSASATSRATGAKPGKGGTGKTAPTSSTSTGRRPPEIRSPFD